MYRQTKSETQEKMTFDMAVEPTAAEKADLVRLERRIDRGLKGGVDALLALLEVYQRKLYQGPKYLSWPDYCQKRWGIKRARAYQVVKHAEVVKDVFEEDVDMSSTVVDFSTAQGGDDEQSHPATIPINERVARELKPLNTAEQRREVFERAKRHSQNGQPTARDVREAREGYFTEMTRSATADIEDEEQELIERAKAHDPDDGDTKKIKKGIREVEKAIRFWGKVPRLKKQVTKLVRVLEEARAKL